MTAKQLIRKCPNLVNFISRNNNSVDNKFNENSFVSIELFLCRFSKAHNTFPPKEVCYDLINLYAEFIKAYGVEINNEILLHDYKIFNKIDEKIEIENNWCDAIYKHVLNIKFFHFTSGMSATYNFFYLKFGENDLIISRDIYHSAFRKFFLFLCEIPINHICQNL